MAPCKDLPLLKEYIRADIAQAEKEAAVAAEREACADIASEKAPATVKAAAIRDRADTDALEAYRRQVRAEALREAAEAVANAGYYCVPPYDETGDLSLQIDHSQAAILALISTNQKENSND
jgi:hypothetical protein